MKNLVTFQACERITTKRHTITINAIEVGEGDGLDMMAVAALRERLNDHDLEFFLTRY